jgi:hypothetical protein
MLRIQRSELESRRRLMSYAGLSVVGLVRRHLRRAAFTAASSVNDEVSGSPNTVVGATWGIMKAMPLAIGITAAGTLACHLLLEWALHALDSRKLVRARSAA